MNKVNLHKFLSAILIISMVSHLFGAVKNPCVSNPRSDSHLLLHASSDTAAFFTSRQNSPKTRGISPTTDRCSLVGFHGQDPWNTYHKNALKSGSQLDSLCQTATLETLYALSCQFTI